MSQLNTFIIMSVFVRVAYVVWWIVCSRDQPRPNPVRRFLSFFKNVSL